MDRFGKAFTAFVLAGMVLSVGAIAYTLSDSEEQVTSQFLSRFHSNQELREYLRDATSQSYYEDTSALMPRGATNEFSLDQTSGGASYSETNVQVAGVDEADQVKTDGEYIYVANWNDVTIVKAYPPSELANVSTVDETDLLGVSAEDHSISVSGIFIHGERLVITASVWKDYDWSYYYDWFAPGRDSVDGAPEIEAWEPSRTMVFLVDVSDVTSPRLEYSVGITGYEITSRMVGDVVYLVAQSSVWQWEEEVFLPRIWTGFESEELSSGSVYYDPETREPSGLIDVMAVNATNGEFSHISVVAGYSSTVYMSQSSLYFTVQKWSGQLTFDNAGNEIVDDSSTRTTIYRVSVDDLNIEVTASGEVKGWLLNQFSMDENGAYLRVATTSDWTNLRNAVYVLDSDLQLVGALEDIAPGEMIYSARFVGDTLYLVTFRQVDPLFVIDLSDPTAPEILGELEIPGFSSYLHPVDDTHVLGIGQENWSVKISLFDVSDPANPVEQSKFLLEQNSHTAAGYDHKAVLFDLEKGLLVIPVYSYWWSPDYTRSGSWTGFYVFGVSVEDGLWLRGTIEVMSWTYDAYYDYSDYYYDDARRALFIGDYLYSLSMYKVKVNLLSDLSEVNTLIYREEQNGGYYVLAG